MKCNCNWADLIVALIIILVTIWPNILGANNSMYVVLIGAAIILVHSIIHPHSWMMKSKK